MSGYDELSSREKQVFLLIAAGKTPKQMASIMEISIKTIATYRHRIVQKTGMKNAQMTLYAERNNLWENSDAKNSDG